MQRIRRHSGAPHGGGRKRYALRQFRGLAQSGRAGRLGRQGRTFESCIPDHFYGELTERSKVLAC